MTLRTLNYGNYGIFLMMGNAGFCPSAVSGRFLGAPRDWGGAPASALVRAASIGAAGHLLYKP